MLTWIEINKKALQHNIAQFRKLIGPKTLLMPVIKSNAYGHGFLEIAKICQKNRLVDRLCVASLDEALHLRKNGISKPIIILTFYELDDKKIFQAIKNNIIFPLYTTEQAFFLNRVGEKLNKKVLVHIKVDIGTSRIGVTSNDLGDFLKQIKILNYIKTEGIFGHFASSEDNKARTKEQFELFKKTLELINRAGINAHTTHVACSAATILHPWSHISAVRMGLSLYGLYPSEKTKWHINLKPALSWHTKIIQVKTVPRGTEIGYGGTFRVSFHTKVATLPIGYWDGYDRGWSNKAHVLIKGKKCPVIGRISMNLTTVDVTKLKTVAVGETATLIGRQFYQSVSAEDLAKITNTINYEVVTKINPSIPRILV